MKLTKNILREHGIYNSYDIAKRLGNKIFVDYIPADNGRGGHSAYWKSCRIDFIAPQNKSKEGTKQFMVGGRQDKQPEFQKTIDWIKKVYNIDITDKDPFGAWHPKGTLEKLKALIKTDK